MSLTTEERAAMAQKLAGVRCARCGGQPAAYDDGVTPQEHSPWGIAGAYAVCDDCGELITPAGGNVTAMTNEKTLEQKIEEHGRRIQRITPQDVQAAIAAECFFTAAEGMDGTLARPAQPAGLDQITLCVLVMRNGQKVVGVNYGPINPDDFNEEEARRLAREDAMRQVLAMMAYQLRSQLAGQIPRSVPILGNVG